MNWFSELISNPFLLVSLSSWFVAQILKVIIDAAIHKHWNWERLFGDGGMPSGHSATVASLAAFSGLACGVGSFQFAVTSILAIIVCHDAMGVRWETGKQAVVINELIKVFNDLASQDISQDVKLKEFVGHTPLQVIAGMTIGIINALVMHFLVFS